MAAITPRNAINAQTMVTNWSAGVGRSAQKWSNGALNPRQLFNANPTAAQTAWGSGVQQAIADGAYASGLTKTDLNAMAASISGPGAQRYSASGTQKVAKYQAKAAALAQAEQQVLASLPADRSTPAARIARMNAWVQGMMALKGKI